MYTFKYIFLLQEFSIIEQTNEKALLVSFGPVKVALLLNLSNSHYLFNNSFPSASEFFLTLYVLFQHRTHVVL